MTKKAEEWEVNSMLLLIMYLLKEPLSNTIGIHTDYWHSFKLSVKWMFGICSDTKVWQHSFRTLVWENSPSSTHMYYILNVDTFLIFSLIGFGNGMSVICRHWLEEWNRNNITAISAQIQEKLHTIEINQVCQSMLGFCLVLKDRMYTCRDRE